MKFIKFWFPVIVYSVIIFCVSAIPNLHVLPSMRFSDKLAHCAQYAILGFLFARALANSAAGHHLPRAQLAAFALLFCLVYGLSDEFHQLFVPGRFASPGDVLADALGGLIGGRLYQR